MKDIKKKLKKRKKVRKVDDVWERANKRFMSQNKKKKGKKK